LKELMKAPTVVGAAKHTRLFEHQQRRKYLENMLL